MLRLSHQIRPMSAGSSAEVFWTGAIPIEPLSLRTAQAGHARENARTVRDATSLVRLRLQNSILSGMPS